MVVYSFFPKPLSVMRLGWIAVGVVELSRAEVEVVAVPQVEVADAELIEIPEEIVHAVRFFRPPARNPNIVNPPDLRPLVVGMCVVILLLAGLAMTVKLLHT